MEKTIKVAEENSFSELEMMYGSVLLIIFTLVSFFMFDLAYYPDWILELAMSKITVLIIFLIIAYIIKKNVDIYNLSKLTLLKRTNVNEYNNELRSNTKKYNGENTSIIVFIVAVVLFFSMFIQAGFEKNIVQNFNNGHVSYKKCIYVNELQYNGKLHKGNICIRADYKKQDTYRKSYSELKDYIKNNILETGSGSSSNAKIMIEYIYNNKEKSVNNIITVNSEPNKMVSIDFTDLVVVGESIKF